MINIARDGTHSKFWYVTNTSCQRRANSMQWTSPDYEIPVRKYKLTCNPFRAKQAEDIYSHQNDYLKNVDFCFCRWWGIWCESYVVEVFQFNIFMKFISYSYFAKKIIILWVHTWPEITHFKWYFWISVGVLWYQQLHRLGRYILGRKPDGHDDWRPKSCPNVPCNMLQGQYVTKRSTQVSYYKH